MDFLNKRPITPNKLLNNNFNDNYLNEKLENSNENFDAIDILLPNECKYYYLNKMKTKEIFEKKLDKEKIEISDICDNFLKKIIMMMEEMKNEIFNKIENNENSFEKIYNSFKDKVDNYLENAKRKINQIPDKEDNTNFNNEDPLTKEIFNLRFQKELADKSEKVFLDIKSDYEKFNINESKEHLANLLLSDESNFNFNKFDEFFINNEKYFKSSIDTFINNYNSNHLNNNKYYNEINVNNEYNFNNNLNNNNNDLNLESAIINNIKKMNFNNQNNNESNVVNIEPPTKIDFKNRVPFNYNQEINTKNLKNLKNNYFQNNSKVNNLKSNNNININYSNKKKLKESNNHTPKLPFVTEDKKEIILNEYFFNPKLKKKLLMNLNNIKSFDINKEKLVVSVNNVLYFYNINDFSKPYKKLERNDTIKNVKIIKNEYNDFSIFVNFYNANSNLVILEENKTKIRLLNHQSKCEDTDYKNYFLSIFDSNLVLYDLFNKDQIDVIELDCGINNFILIGKNKLVVSSNQKKLYVIEILNNKLNISNCFEKIDNISCLKKFYNNDKMILLGTNEGKVKVFDIKEEIIKNEINFGYSSIKDLLIFICMIKDPIINCLCYDGNNLYFSQVDNLNSVKIGYLNTIKDTELKILDYSEKKLKILFIDSEGLGKITLVSG